MQRLTVLPTSLLTRCRYSTRILSQAEAFGINIPRITIGNGLRMKHNSRHPAS
jgi:hypothetical protein